nr:nucleotidyltransferase domain-containing protein [Neobacillus sp. Marseille-Q6967]
MQNHILEVLKQIELEYDVKILYACEAGSRSWGYPSENSDYDVRFIYVHKTDWYLSIDQRRDVLEVPKHDKVSLLVEKQLDLSGWELTKALKLFRKSNPPLMEWLHSSIVYYQAYSTIEKMKEMEGQVFSPISCLYHYLKMAKGNYRDYVKKDEVRIKSYFNIFRPLLAAKWIVKYNTVPPIEFNALLDDLLPSGEVRDILVDVITLKIAGEVLDEDPQTEVILAYLLEEFENLESYLKELKVDIPNPTEKLNLLLRETLLEVWGD